MRPPEGAAGAGGGGRRRGPMGCLFFSAAALLLPLISPALSSLTARERAAARRCVAHGAGNGRGEGSGAAAAAAATARRGPRPPLLPMSTTSPSPAPPSPAARPAYERTVAGKAKAVGYPAMMAAQRLPDGEVLRYIKVRGTAGVVGRGGAESGARRAPSRERARAARACGGAFAPPWPLAGAWSCPAPAPGAARRVPPPTPLHPPTPFSPSVIHPGAPRRRPRPRRRHRDLQRGRVGGPVGL